MCTLVMPIFNRFFDKRLNQLSKTCFFTKFDFELSLVLKSKNRSLRLIVNRLFHLTTRSVFCFFNMAWNYNTYHVLKKQNKKWNRRLNGTGSFLLVVRIDFSIIDFFRTDYRLDQLLFFDRFWLKSIKEFREIDITSVLSTGAVPGLLLRSVGCHMISL